MYNLKKLAIISIIFCCALLLISDNQRFNNHFEENIMQSWGTVEDPFARAKFQWMRLRNPATNSIAMNIYAGEQSFTRNLKKKNAERQSIFKKTAKAATKDWIQRGPCNFGGRTRALAIDISDNDILLAGGTSGGMWRSTNNGAFWTRTTRPDQIPCVTCVVQDTRPGKTHIWYYGTGEYMGNSAGVGTVSYSSEGPTYYAGNGIIKSEDGGCSWSVLESTSTDNPEYDKSFDYVFDLAVDHTTMEQDVVYAATYGSIQRSTDGGKTWSLVLGEESPWYIFGSYWPWTTIEKPVHAIFTDVEIAANGTVYASLGGGGEKDGLYRSTDGINWTNITPEGWPVNCIRITIACAPSNPDIVYFLAGSPGEGSSNHSLWKYTYISGDGTSEGVLWENRSSNLPYNPENSLYCYNSGGGYMQVSVVKPDDENVLFIGGWSLWRSTDGFSTTQSTTQIGGRGMNDHHVDQQSVAFSPSEPDFLYNGNDGGVFYTENCLSDDVRWTSLNNGYYTTQFYTVGIDKDTNGDETVFGGTQDWGTFWVSVAYPLAPWRKVLSGDGGFCAKDEEESIYYISQTGFRIFARSEQDIIQQISRYEQITPDEYTGSLFINPFILDPNNYNTMYASSGKYVWRNNSLRNNPLEKWETLWNTETTGTFDFLSHKYISALEVSTNPSDILYYGTDDGKLYRLDNARTSSETPENIWEGKGFPENAYINCIAVDPEDADKAIVVFSNYGVKSLFYTSDKGASWADISGNLEEFPDGSGNGPSVRWAEILPTGSSDIYFAATSTGLYSTSELKGSDTIWIQEGPETIGNVVVEMIDSRSIDGYVAIATHGNGIFSTNVVTAVEDDEVQKPEEFQLLQNYPNPFNSGTNIKFHLPANLNISVNIYNIKGQLVKTLVNREYPSGTYTVTWNGTNDADISVGSGTYICRLIAGNKIASKKMLLLK
ncbi:MAG: T9SS type A sorting domain-containing protein [bacterium]|nr:T9SS type A sorting domain-containing protein [bacterium]